MAQRLKKVAFGLLGVVLTLPLIAYAVLFMANLNDRQPAPELATLKSLQNTSSPIVSDDNSYLFMLGFSGPPDADPMLLGLGRYEWMKTARPEFRMEDDPLGEDLDFRSVRSEAVEELAEACSESEIDCLRALESGEAVLEEWLTEERWLLDRYSSLISKSGFREAMPFEMTAPLPPYGVIREGQRLYLAKAWKSAASADAGAVNIALEEDLVYWRMVLENSDALITKFIATAAIIRHFKLGNLVLRRLPPQEGGAGLPASWRQEISDGERSMKRSLAGEWIYFSESTRKIMADNENPMADWTGFTDPKTSDRLGWIVLEPLWQHQDLINRHGRLMLNLGDAFSVPYDEMPDAVERADRLQESAFRPFSRLYNFAGDLVMGLGDWSYSDYAARISDLEGVRRAALLAARLRSEDFEKRDVAQHLLVSEIEDPYTGNAFSWRESLGTITFFGLEPHDRSRHEIIY